MKPLGIDLGAMGREAPSIVDDGAPPCPGARLWLTRPDLAEYRRGGEVFATVEIPPDGYGAARVQCSGTCAPVTRRGAGGQFYGLCSSCSQTEEDNRATLRLRQQAGGK